jgi:hypothetical protein
MLKNGQKAIYKNRNKDNGRVYKVISHDSVLGDAPTLVFVADRNYFFTFYERYLHYFVEVIP